MKIPRTIKRLFLRQPIILFLLWILVWIVYYHTQMIKEVSNIKTHPQETLIKLYKDHPRSLVTKDISLTNVDGPCQNVPKFTFHNHTIISTYDLPSITNFTLRAEKEYYFPVHDKSVAYRQNLSHLDIFIVPFSHVDPGYGMTFEQYYRLKVKGILDSMVHKLEIYQDMTFQWAEVVFLERWWRDINVDMKMRVRKLIRKGQLEIVLGGWVMPDEAVTSVEGLVDQLIEGHQWVQDKLGTIPETSWANDPFGYSGVMAYLLKSSGIKNMVILRVHQAIKATLAQKKSLEFIWRPYLVTGTEYDILCHVMPYTGYWIRDVCGPNKALCKDYAFMHTVGENLPVWINDTNLAERARLLCEQYRITAELYKYNTLYIGLGEDFSYGKPAEWDLVYSNFKKIMGYMNKKSSWNVSIKFGTLREYFRHVRNNEKRFSFGRFPTVSGDWFPYSDWNSDYWTGFYTTRPFQKCFAYEIERIIKIIDVYLVLFRSQNYLKKTTTYSNIPAELGLMLRGPRRILHTFLHHDGITGTSVQEVISQYDFNLYQAYTQAMSVLKRLVTIIMSKGEIYSTDILEYETYRKSRDNIPEHIPLIVTETGTKLLIVNTLPRKREMIISFRALSNSISMTDRTGNRIKAQIQPYLKALGPAKGVGYEFTFKMTAPPFAVETMNLNITPNTYGREFTEIHLKPDLSGEVVIRNDIFSATFNATTGMLQSVTDYKGRKTIIESSFMLYDTIKSGAYVFKPLSEAKPVQLDFQKASVKCIRGEIVSEVRVLYNEGIYQSYKVYNTSSIRAHGLYLRTEINIRPASFIFWANKEIVLRFKTDINNNGHFYTDQNGLSLIGRKTLDTRPIGGNFYPITKMALLEDNEKRLTFHTRQPHGVANLKNGWLEIMLDRSMITDDHKGLGQGVMDNKLTENNFALHIEYKKSPFPVEEERYTFESQLASLVNEDLQYSIILLHETKMNNGRIKTFKDSFKPMRSNLPCDVSVLGLRDLWTEEMELNGTSLIFYRKTFHCGFPTENLYCSFNETVSVQSVFPWIKSVVAYETSLTHLHRKRSVTISEDLRPSQNEIRSFWFNFD